MSLKKVVVYNGYSVTSASVLSDYDRNILTLLYQPLCGHGALALYLTLWCKYEMSKNSVHDFHHHSLFANMDCNVNEFETYRDRLEGLGLLKTFVKEEDTPFYCYELYAPLDPQDFFKHELLGTLLKQRLDEEEYNELKAHFMLSKGQLDGYYDLSHSFNEVYNLDMNDTNSLQSVIDANDELAKRNNAKIGTSFSLEIFLMILKENKIRKSLINNNLVNLMESMANLYKLDEYELCNVLISSIEGLGNQERVDYDTFKRKCFEYRKVLKVSTKDVKALENKKQGISKKAEMLQELEPFQFLRIKQGNVDPSKQDVKLIEDLSLMSKLNPGVINVLLDYVMLNKQNTLPYNYVMKIASSLARENIQTAVEAMEYFHNFKSQYKKNPIKKTEMISEEKEETEEIDEAKELERLKRARKERKNNATIEA